MMSLSEWEAELKCSATGKPRIVSNATQVFTEAFPQPPPSLTNVQAAAATTHMHDRVDHILELASKAVTDAIKAFGTL